MNGSRWAPLGPGLLGIDWGSALKPKTRVDPYLLWYDTTPGMQDLPLVLELSQPFNRDVLVALNELGLRVTPHYIDWRLANGAAPRNVTASCAGTTVRGHSLSPWPPASVRWFAMNSALACPTRTTRVTCLPESSAIASRIGRDQAWQPAAPIVPIAHQHIVGFIDYGCAFAHRHFDRDDQGTLRVHALWNQEQDIDPSTPGRPHLGWKQAERFARGWSTGASMLQVFRDMHGRAGTIAELTCYRDAQSEPVLRPRRMALSLWMWRPDFRIRCGATARPNVATSTQWFLRNSRDA